MLRIRCFIRLTAVILTLSLGGFSAVSLVTLHYHVLANGQVVAHSHPLPDSNQGSSHKHTRQQYAELDAAGQMLDTIVPEPVLYLSAAEYSTGRISLEPVSIPVFIPAWQISRRGPPFLS